MRAFVEGDLRIDVEIESGWVRTQWRGRSGARDPAATLRPFLEEVADEASAAKARVDLRIVELEYFNSATLSVIIHAIRRLRGQNTRVRVSYRESADWQRRSCDALRILESPDLVEICGE